MSIKNYVLFIVAVLMVAVSEAKYSCLVAFDQPEKMLKNFYEQQVLDSKGALHDAMKDFDFSMQDSEEQYDFLVYFSMSNTARVMLSNTKSLAQLREKVSRTILIVVSNQKTVSAPRLTLSAIDITPKFNDETDCGVRFGFYGNEIQQSNQFTDALNALNDYVIMQVKQSFQPVVKKVFKKEIGGGDELSELKSRIEKLEKRVLSLEVGVSKKEKEEELEF